MAHEAHASQSHDDPGILGGLLDLAAVGLGGGLAIGGLLMVGGILSVPAWFGLAATTGCIGAIVGSIWGKNRGY